MENFITLLPKPSDFSACYLTERTCTFAFAIASCLYVNFMRDFIYSRLVTSRNTKHHADEPIRYSRLTLRVKGNLRSGDFLFFFGGEKKKKIPLQSPRGFSALARLYYLVRPTKTAMLRRLVPTRTADIVASSSPEVPLLHDFEECHGESSAVCNRASLKSLAFAASDSSKSSLKIAYPERNTVEKKPVVTV